LRKTWTLPFNRIIQIQNFYKNLAKLQNFVLLLRLTDNFFSIMVLGQPAVIVSTSQALEA
ncbi:hypothetical protein U8M15_27750, partial [Klebsiella pneumoniae]|uniref:hypothetical protein n=1 Tax=Klebsiella pneumoniae TaxID=573 RepID=UPI002ADF27E3